MCLTCGLDGPNQVPVARPGGDWILFHSWNGHGVRVAGPGFGGIGSDVWVMSRDGAQRTNLTRAASSTTTSTPTGRPTGGSSSGPRSTGIRTKAANGKSDVRVARFDPNGPTGRGWWTSTSVRPGNGHWYETQWWAPDGSGFLYTETYDEAVNPELFFCRLRDPARGDCRPRAPHHNPAWDEQAIFTPT